MRFMTLIVLLVLTTQALARDATEQKDRRYHLLLLGSTAAITVWGVLNWDYGSRTPHTGSEGWFGLDTKHGGADKVGHFYSSYVLANALPTLYRSWGFSDHQAAVRGLWSSLLINGYMEVGDSFSDYGFSGEDLTANAAGSLAGYWLDRHPWWDERVTLKVEYLPSPDRPDFFTDYEHMKFLAAMRLDTFTGTEHSRLRFLELQAGYFTRGFDDADDPPRRYWFVGLGLNFTALARALGWHRTGAALRYWQPPDSSPRYEHSPDQ